MRLSWGIARDGAFITALGISLYLNMAQAARAETLARRLGHIRENCIVIDVSGMKTEEHRRVLLEAIRAAMDPEVPSRTSVRSPSPQK